VISAAPLRHASSTLAGPKLVSLVVPVFNEALIMSQNLRSLVAYLQTLEPRYNWELIVVDDGSTDDTARLADEFASRRPNVRVIHHARNAGLSAARLSGFEDAGGDVIVTYDVDLSYTPEHIERLLSRLQSTGAGIVLASAYAKGGHVSNVPLLRRVLSRWANRFLSVAFEGRVATLTCMIRAYDAASLRTLLARAQGIDTNLQLPFVARPQGVRIEEISAHLDWGRRDPAVLHRCSSMRNIDHTIRVIRCVFRYRPSMVAAIPGLVPGFLPIALAPFFFMHASSGTIWRATMIIFSVQVLSLALFSWHVGRYLHRVFSMPRRVPANRNELTRI